MEHLCDDCQQPLQFHNAEVKWIDGKWEVLSVDESTGHCESCGYVLVYTKPEGTQYTVLYRTAEHRAIKVYAESEEEARNKVLGFEAYQIWDGDVVDTEAIQVLDCKRTPTQKTYKYTVD